MNNINIGSRVWLHDLNGPFVVKSLDSLKAHCSHEFIGIEISPNISSLTLTDIQHPDIGFWVDIPDNDYPHFSSSNHFENDYSEDCVMNFYCSILDRTISYFKKYNYSHSSMFEFQKELELLLSCSEDESAELTNFFVTKHRNKLPRDYQNSYMILFSDKDGLITFYVPQYGDASLQLTILFITQYIHGKLNIDLALRVTKILFKELEKDLNLEDFSDEFTLD